MDNHKICPIIISELMDYVYTNIINYFSSINIHLSPKFLLLTQKDIYCLIESYLSDMDINLSINKILSSNYHNLINHVKIEIDSKLAYRSRMIIFSSIKLFEPEEIIIDFLRSPNNFTLLLYFCYKDFIEKTAKKNSG